MPLGLSGVDSCWVVGADVEHDNRVVLGSVEVSLHAFKVQALGLLAIVAVVLPLVANEVSNCSMNGPRRVGNQEIDVLVWVPLREESETEAKSTGTRDGLGACDSALLASTAIFTIGQSEALIDI